MLIPDKECHEIITLFLKKKIKRRYPILTKSVNPAYKRKGNSFDFKNIREYEPCDDIRNIDWKLFGRTERFYIKDFFEEEDLPIYFLVDSSASISVYDTAIYKKTILSLAFILLSLNYTINMIKFDNTIIGSHLSVKGDKNTYKIAQFLDSIRFEGTTNLDDTLIQLRQRYQPSILFIFSDFYCTFTNRKHLIPKKTFLIHFYTSFKDLLNEYNEYEIYDNETNSEILYPFNNITEKILASIESDFLKQFEDDKQKHKYMYAKQLKTDSRMNLYWIILESLYD